MVVKFSERFIHGFLSLKLGGILTLRDQEFPNINHQDGIYKQLKPTVKTVWILFRVDVCAKQNSKKVSTWKAHLLDNHSKVATMSKHIWPHWRTSAAQRGGTKCSTFTRDNSVLPRRLWTCHWQRKHISIFRSGRLEMETPSDRWTTLSHARVVLPGDYMQGRSGVKCTVSYLNNGVIANILDQNWVARNLTRNNVKPSKNWSETDSDWVCIVTFWRNSS